MNGLEPSNLSAEYDRVPQRSPVAATRVSLGEWSTAALFAELFEQDIEVIQADEKYEKPPDVSHGQGVAVQPSIHRVCD